MFVKMLQDDDKAVVCNLSLFVCVCVYCASLPVYLRESGIGWVWVRHFEVGFEDWLVSLVFIIWWDTTYLIKRPCYQRESPCQDSAGNRTTRRPPDYRKETQTAVVRTCLPFIRSGQNHLVRHSERGKKTRQTEEEVGRRQHQGMARPRVRQVSEGSGDKRKWGKLDVKSSAVPQRPSRLRDTWWWWWLPLRPYRLILCETWVSGTEPWGGWSGPQISSEQSGYMCGVDQPWAVRL